MKKNVSDGDLQRILDELAPGPPQKSSTEEPAAPSRQTAAVSGGERSLLWAACLVVGIGGALLWWQLSASSREAAVENKPSRFRCNPRPDPNKTDEWVRSYEQGCLERKWACKYMAPNQQLWIATMAKEHGWDANTAVAIRRGDLTAVHAVQVGHNAFIEDCFRPKSAAQP